MGFTTAFLMLLAASTPNMFDDVVVIEDECVDFECEEIDSDPDLTNDETLNPAEYELNETFTFDVFEYTFTDAYFTEVEEVLDEHSIEYYGEADNILVIDFEYTNVSTIPESPRYYLSFYGDNYIIEEYAHLNSIPEVNPGRNGRGQLIYNVPDDVELLEIEINTYDYSNHDRAIVNIDVSE
ncbi:hypothetical protein [Aliicoccus persicus]|uniref:DUF4352 domain-containing protein n=1 Tax=Aliicoccus persicus TaxID=930138 RepID=A0A662Z3B9_9STAP|nr:hypothetical protein [Aliicoccus persicus]SEV91565.1 hypothetical protein SAMN05192557_0745 [Aliicoccus persicus]